MLRALCALFFLVSVAAVASAADSFSRMDADNDGLVVWEEFSAALPNMKRAAFDTIDANKDGAVSRAEWDAFAADHGQKHRGQGASAVPGGGDKPLIEPPRK